MNIKKDPRGSLACKCGALVLLIAAAAGAALCSAAVVLFSCGYGTAGTFQDDILCRDTMDTAMVQAQWYVRAGDDYYYYRMERYGGFSAQVYQGEPLPENLLGAYGEVPEHILCQMTKKFHADAGGEYVTVVGYLSEDIPSGSNFDLLRQLYNTLSGLRFGGAMLLAALLWLAAAGALVFLLCAAGHREGREGIVLNWQDRIPLDLYLCCAMGAGSIAAFTAFDWHRLPMALELCVCFLGLLALDRKSVV